MRSLCCRNLVRCWGIILHQLRCWYMVGCSSTCLHYLLGFNLRCWPAYGCLQCDSRHIVHCLHCGHMVECGPGADECVLRADRYVPPGHVLFCNINSDNGSCVRKLRNGNLHKRRNVALNVRHISFRGLPDHAELDLPTRHVLFRCSKRQH